MSSRFFKSCIIIICLMTVCRVVHAEENMVVQAVTDKAKVSVGEPLILQVQVQGTDQVKPADDLNINGFLVVPGGGQATNRVYTSSINGQMQTREFKGYVYTYRLLPLKEGIQVIPAMAVKAGGQTNLTRPIRIDVVKPKINPDFHVVMKMEKQNVYTGEEIKCNITVYFNKRIDDPWIYIPELADPAFRINEIPVENPDRSYVTVMLNNKRVLAKVGQNQYLGKNYYTLELTRYIQPLRSGVFSFEPALASFNMVTGYQANRRRSPFSGMFEDDFFDDPFFSGRKPVVERSVARSQPEQLTVLQLPAAGKPVNFNGLIGRYSIASKVEPSQAAVGQPMTLTVMVAGDGYMNNVELPDLNLQGNISKYFKVSSDVNKGKMVSGVKVFTYTIRAKNPDAKEFPPIELNYFNSESGNYDTALSKAFPLTITAAKKVTINDVEGMANEKINAGNAIESAGGGIRHNYSYGQGVVEKMARANLLNSGKFLLLVVIPPAIYLLIVCGKLVARRRELNSGSRRSNNAIKKLRSDMRNLQNRSQSAELLLGELNNYFSCRLELPVVAVSYAEILPVLQERGVSVTSLENLKKIFEHLEACRYGGGIHGQVVSDKFMQGTLQVMENLDKQLG